MKKSRKTERIDCLGMGIIPLDLLFNVAGYPKAGMKINATRFFMQGGGPVPNVAVGLVRLGFRTALIAPVGDDPFGRLLIEELKKDRVDVRFMVIKGRPTALASGWIEDGSGRRTMVLSRQVFVTPSDIRTSAYPIPRIVHLDGRDMPATLKLARWARRKKIPVSFDIGSMRNDVSAVFPYVDHLVVADSYAIPFTGARTARGAITRLAHLCPGTIVVTEGVKGSLGRERKPDGGVRFTSHPAYRVKTVDATGAGDCYHTGYLYGLLKGYDLRERMKYGSAAAALKCMRPGARSGIPNEARLLKFLRSNPPIYR